jgi:hypothetical protein
MATRVTRISATTSLPLALAAGVGLALWPCAYQGIEAQPTPGGAPPSSRPTASTCSACSPCRCCLPAWGWWRSAPAGASSWPPCWSPWSPSACWRWRRWACSTYRLPQHSSSRWSAGDHRQALRPTADHHQPDKCGWWKPTVPLNMGCMNVTTGSACVPGRDTVGDHGLHGHIVSATSSTIVSRCRPHATFAAKRCNLG